MSCPEFPGDLCHILQWLFCKLNFDQPQIQSWGGIKIRLKSISSSHTWSHFRRSQPFNRDLKFDDEAVHKWCQSWSSFAGSTPLNIGAKMDQQIPRFSKCLLSLTTQLWVVNSFNRCDCTVRWWDQVFGGSSVLDGSRQSFFLDENYTQCTVIFDRYSNQILMQFWGDYQSFLSTHRAFSLSHSWFIWMQ